MFMRKYSSLLLIIFSTLMFTQSCKQTDYTESTSKRFSILGKWQFKNVLYQIYINDSKTDEGEENNFTDEDTMTFDTKEQVTIKSSSGSEYKLFYYFDITNTKITFKNGEDLRVYELVKLDDKQLILKQDVTSSEPNNNAESNTRYRLISQQTLER